MLPLKYAYLTGELLFFVPWALIFWRRKNLRKEILVVGLIAAIGELVTAYFWTTDWWRPKTITGTRLGIEDFLLGLDVGIAPFLYEVIFGKESYHRDKREHKRKLLLLVILTLAIFGATFFVLEYTSFFSCLISLTIFCSILVYLRKDLFISSLINGLLMVLIVIPFYLILIYLFKGFITSTYPFTTLSGKFFLGIPIEELIIWFVFGVAIFLAYKYWRGLGIRILPKTHKR